MYENISSSTRSHDAGTKHCRHKMRVCSSLFFFSFLNFTLITVDNIYHSQNVSSNRNETLTVTCSHSAKTVEFRYGFKLLRLTIRFHILSCPYRVNATPKRKNFVSLHFFKTFFCRQNMWNRRLCVSISQIFYIFVLRVEITTIFERKVVTISARNTIMQKICKAIFSTNYNNFQPNFEIVPLSKDSLQEFRVFFYQTSTCGVVVTTLAFQAGRLGFNPWSDLYSRS